MKKLISILALLACVLPSRAATSVTNFPVVTVASNGLYLMVWPNDGSTNVYRITINSLLSAATNGFLPIAETNAATGVGVLARSNGPTLYQPKFSSLATVTNPTLPLLEFRTDPAGIADTTWDFANGLSPFAWKVRVRPRVWQILDTNSSTRVLFEVFATNGSVAFGRTGATNKINGLLTVTEALSAEGGITAGTGSGGTVTANSFESPTNGWQGSAFPLGTNACVIVTASNILLSDLAGLPTTTARSGSLLIIASSGITVTNPISWGLIAGGTNKVVSQTVEAGARLLISGEVWNGLATNFASLKWTP